MKVERTTAKHLKDLMETLGHQFNETSLLELALTHSSMLGENKILTTSNERLEFLGDRVLGLVIAELLLQIFPHENEGDLSRRHAELVRMETLGNVGAFLNLGKFINLSRGEESMGGRNNPALLADVCEAVIAALYMDGGFNTAANFIKKIWRPYIHNTSLPPKDPKTNLQEWAQKRGLPVPRYSEIERQGPDHKPLFTVEVEVVGQIPFSGDGQSKRAAEQNAADNMLKNLTCAKI